MVDVSWLNKAIWKSALNEAIKYVLLFEKSFLKGWTTARNSYMQNLRNALLFQKTQDYTLLCRG